MRKRTLTLLEVMIAVTLLGFLLTGLFRVFFQSVKYKAASQELKAKLLPLELFQLRMKTLLTEGHKVWLEDYPGAIKPALLFTFEEKAPPEAERVGQLQGVLFLNEKKQLCLASFPKKGKGRVEVLFDEIQEAEWSLFDSEKKEWKGKWPEKKEEISSMAKLKLRRMSDKDKGTEFVFFLSSEPIVYKGRA